MQRPRRDTATALAALLLAAAAAGAPSRPASVIQRAIDAARPGATVHVAPGMYIGEIVADRPITLIGDGRPQLVGGTGESVIRIRGADVTVSGFDIDGRGRGDLGADASGIHISGTRARVRDCRIVRTLFGIYLHEAHGAVVENCSIRGIREKEAGEKGSGIHVWDTSGFRITGNDLVGVRDGFYIQSSSHGYVARNVATDLRYGLHYMFSDDNVFEDNLFSNGDAGGALMYSRRIVFRRNRFVHNRGYASVGLLFKACDDSVAESNLIADNARGIFLEGSYRNIFTGNVIAKSDTAIVLYDSASGNRFEGNSFVENLTPLTLYGHRTDTVFARNYWSGNPEPDLDGDGFTDRPYRLSNVFDHFRENVSAADLLAQGLGARALAAAEEAFPVLDPIHAEDAMPLARAPYLPDVPRMAASEKRRSRGGMALSVALLLSCSVIVFGRGVARHRPRERRGEP